MPKSSSRNIPAGSVPLPELLMHVVLAARDERQRDSTRHTGDHSATLIELARIIALHLPARGVLAPGDDLCNEIDRVAQRHLHRREADRQFRDAIEQIEDVARRDAIEIAHGRLVEVSEVAHYYAGLAAGITLAGFGRQS
jgi:hypothetical protein